MKWSIGVFAAAFAEVARAVPQKGIVPIFPIRNSTTPKPEPTDSGCAAQCSVYYPELSALSWVPEVSITYTTTITVGTVSVRVLTESNSTLDIRTDTIYGYVPPEYDLYMQTTDDAGTAVAQVRLTGSDGYTFTNIAYPTPYVNYFTEYLWGGVLPTSDKEYSPICATATDGLSNGILPQHPEYPQPKEVRPSDNDTLGTSSQPLWMPIAEEPDKLFFDVAFPSESAFASCESLPGRTKPLPTDFYAAKYVFDTTTETTTPFTVPLVGIMSTETGWEVTTPTKKADKTDGPDPFVPTGRPDNWPQMPHFESSESDFGRTFEPPPVATPKPSTKPGNPPSNDPGDPDPGSSPQGDPDQDIPNAIVSLINNNPQIFTPASDPNNPRPPSNNQNDPNNPPALPAVVSTPAPAATPVFTFVPTMVNGQSTTIPAFILPGSSATATIGQTVTVNGQPTVLTPPPAIFTLVPTTINGIATIVPAYIIRGTSTASIGQTVTLDGKPTVLSPPLAVWTLVPTTINGQATSIFAYVYPSVTSAPAPAQTKYGPDVVLTMMETTINGTPTAVPVWVISGSITATPGQTVTIGGKTTVLATPTSSVAVGISTRGGSNGGGEVPQATGTGGSAQGTGSRDSPTVGLALCIGLGFALLAWL